MKLTERFECELCGQVFDTVADIKFSTVKRKSYTDGVTTIKMN